jgi:uncharacterized protein YfaT (DUF1175 family)
MPNPAGRGVCLMRASWAVRAGDDADHDAPVDQQGFESDHARVVQRDVDMDPATVDQDTDCAGAVPQG